MSQAVTIKLSMAILLSLLLHGLLLLPFNWFEKKPLASSAGHGQVILLDAKSIQPIPSKDDTNEQQVLDSQQGDSKSQKSVTKDSQISEIAAAKDLQSKEKAQQKIKQQTANQGSLEDQSGKALSPTHDYRILIYQHLLNKMQSVPYNGKAKIELDLLSMGVASQVKVTVLEGQVRYGRWVKKVVLSANPFPPAPPALKGQGIIKMELVLTHQPDNKN